jgi:hypothetical protein
MGDMMTTRYLNIDEKHRQDGALLASIKDFTVSDGEMVDTGSVLNKPNVSLYCFDDENNRAIFAELPPEINLATVPFVYQAQYDTAQRLIAVPYNNFREFAYTLPPVKHLIMIYSSARSGTTLMSHVFNELDSVLSLSERVLCKPDARKTPTTYVLKGRMEMLLVMDLFAAAIPHAKNLYLYRDAIGVIRSFYRILKNFPIPETFPVAQAIAQFNILYPYDLTPNTVYLDPGTEMVSLIHYLTLLWITGVEWYMEHARTVLILAVRYADLNESREKTLEAIFAYCGLPVEQVAKTLGAYERDSQAGTLLARENPKEGNQLQLTEAEVATVSRILARHPIIQKSDFVAPNTLQV